MRSYYRFFVLLGVLASFVLPYQSAYGQDGAIAHSSYAIDAIVDTSITTTASPIEPIGDGARRIKNGAFEVGEKLVYSIQFGLIQAGKSVVEIAGIEVVNGRRCYRVVSTTESNKAFSVFYRVRDRVESFIDVEGIYPWKFEKHLREGTYRADRSVIYDQINHLAITNGDTISVPPYVQDGLSAFYYIRTQELEVGQTLLVDNHDNAKVYPLKVKVLRRDVIKTKLGKLACLVIEPMLKSGALFKHQGRLTVWLTDDDRKIPVRMKSKIVIGHIDVRLVEYSINGENRENVEIQADRSWESKDAPVRE